MSRKKTVLAVVGARPNFMKTAPILAELRRRSDEFDAVLVHTGQHYDAAMSDIFFEELGVGPPDHMLGVGSGSHAAMTARVMERIEPLLEQVRPDVVLVPGDVNSTLAAALVATKLGYTVAHVEAGLRSFDRTMPEEINRILTDQVSDLLFVHSPEAVDNLRREGVDEAKIHAVGNTMIDTLAQLRNRIVAVDAPRAHGLGRHRYLVVTLHRPALVDGPLLRDAVEALQDIAAEIDVVFPCHPRTRARIEQEGMAVGESSHLRVVEPLGYMEFLSLVEGSAGTLTDSGGIQEETTWLGVPCFTLRANTERPVTCTIGTNTLLGLDPARIRDVPGLLAARNGDRAGIPAGWDGAASGRIVDVLAAES